MPYISFLTETVVIPVWLLILMIGAVIPLIVKLFKLLIHFRQGEIIREEHSDMVLWKLRRTKQPASRNKSASDFAKEKSREKENDILHVLQNMAAESDKGMLLQTIADRMNTGTSRVKQAMLLLINKKLVEEVVGVSGTKYYLTKVGKNYCMRKGFTKAR